jgi:hypothetical protein
MSKCECGNNIDPRNVGEDATQCEWCEYPSYDWVMWREAVGGGWLQQMETHGGDRLHWVRFDTGEEVSVWANSFDIAEYIAGEWLARKEYA